MWLPLIYIVLLHSLQAQGDTEIRVVADPPTDDYTEEQYDGLTPYIVSIQDRTQTPAHFANGVMVGIRWILTSGYAGSLIETKLATDKVYIKFGSTDVTAEGPGHNREVRKVHKHPQYGGDTSRTNNLAVLRTCKDFELDQKFAKLAPVLKNVEFFSYGWSGHMLHLRDIKNTLIADSACATKSAQVVSGGTFVPEQHLCIKHEDGRGICDNDHGSPLIGLYRGFHVIGVLSKEACGVEAKGSDTFTELSKEYINWIYSIADPSKVVP